MGDATSSPGRTRAASSGHYDPARSDDGQRHKGQDAALARRKARGVTLHAQGPAIRARPGATHSRTRSRATWVMRLVARHPPTEEERNAGDPLAQSRKQGPISFDSRRQL